MEIFGRTAIVTGGASGLGEATVRSLSERGARVVIFDMNFERAEHLADEFGGLAVRCDVVEPDSVTSGIEKALSFGQPRILVNCAGVAPAEKILSRRGVMPLENFRRAIEINLVGTFNLMRMFVNEVSGFDDMEGGERGVIINTASIAGYEGQIGQSAYAASKAGVIGLTLPAARELAPLGIRVCTIAPGLFETPMLSSLSEVAQQNLAKQALFPPRLGRPREFSALALHIIENQMLNGEVIRLDGALRMTPT